MRSPPPLLAVLGIVVAAGCGEPAGETGGDAAVTAVATTTQVADLARNVGGERVEVAQLLRPASDPHGYEPRPSDVAALADADLVLRSGGDVDEWLGELIDSAGTDAPTVTLIDAVGAGARGEQDPHWWQDPRRAIAAVAAIEAALAEVDPDGADAYRRRAAAYSRRLRRLDREVAACLRRVPPQRRRLVTTHGALGPYADRYGLQVVGTLIPSRSTAAQPSAGDVEALVDRIERAGAPAIFPESSLSPRLERAVAREAGAAVGGALWADSLGPEDSDGATYVASIESNTEAIVAGLTGGEVRCGFGG